MAHLKKKNFFCKTIYSFHKNGTQRIQETNHYILLTNVSIKRCIRPRLKPISSGGERVPTRQVPYRQNQVNIHVVHFSAMLCFQADNSATEY